MAKPVDPALLITEISRVMELARQVQSLRSGRPYELVLYARSNSSDYPLLRRLVDRLRGEFDTSLVRIALREPAVASTEVPAMGVAQQQAILVHLEESPPLRISCDTADVELLLQRLRETGLPRRRID